MYKKIRKGGYEIEISVPEEEKRGKTCKGRAPAVKRNINIYIDDRDDMDLCEMELLLDD